MNENRPIQLDFVGRVSDQAIEWAKKSNISLHNIETVVPFATSDKDLDVWLFFDTDEIVNNYEKNGTTEKVKKEFLQTLENLKYPSYYLDQVTFQIDSHENVVKNYEGSYFYRLRLKNKKKTTLLN